MVYKTSRKNRKSSRRRTKSIRRTKKCKGGAVVPGQAPIIAQNQYIDSMSNKPPGQPPVMNKYSSFAPGPAPVPAQGPPVQTVPNPQKCDLFDTKFPRKENEIWKTCITVDNQPRNMIYITPRNVVIKSIETIQIPEFIIRVLDEDTGIQRNVKCVIKIEDKYVGCFVFINGYWYAIMRLFGSTLNTEYLARTEKNKVFYKLGGMTVDINVGENADKNNNGTGVIIINTSMYNKKYIKTLLGNSKSPTITLTQEFVNINKENGAQGNIFTSLQEFRQQKLLGNNVKQQAAYTTFDVLLGLFR